MQLEDRARGRAGNNISHKSPHLLLWFPKTKHPKKKSGRSQEVKKMSARAVKATAERRREESFSLEKYT